MTPDELLVLRKACGRTIEWLATECGVSRNTAQRWENPQKWHEPVPKDVERRVVAEFELIEEMVDEVCERIEEFSPDKKVVMFDRHDPRSIAVAWRLRELFPEIEMRSKQSHPTSGFDLT